MTGDRLCRLRERALWHIIGNFLSIEPPRRKLQTLARYQNSLNASGTIAFAAGVFERVVVSAAPTDFQV